MKAKKCLCALGLIIGLGSFTACTNDTASNEEQLFEQQAIDGNEIKDQDM